MNMKKTIAAIAAGAVAVSAMATTASAALDAQTLTFSLVEKVYKANAGTVTYAATFSNVDLSGVDMLKIGLDTNGSALITSVDTITLTGRYNADSKQIPTIVRANGNWNANYDSTFSNGFVEIPVGVGKPLEQQEATFTIEVKCSHMDKDNWISPANAAIDAGLAVAINKGTAGAAESIAAVATTDVNASITAANVDMATYKAFTSSAASTVFTYNGTNWQVNGSNVTIADYGLSVTGATDNGDVITVTYNAGSTGGYAGNTNGKTIVVDGSWTNATDNNIIDKEFPMVSNLGTPARVINAIVDADPNDNITTPAQVLAVLNDAVANYSDVTFTFNTATRKVNTNPGADYGKYDDKGSDAYLAFGKHYWGITPGYDVNTIYFGNDWIGNNLWGGALVVNNNLTLSLSDVQGFDWTKTSISFTWDDIMNEALTQNAYALYIQTMDLYTSGTWFWDNMVVSLANTEAPDASAGAGKTEPDDSYENKDTADDNNTADDNADNGDADNTDENKDTEGDAGNPETGNASVALAVIPVALAAAAIVAKKIG